jgi:hypothetical protein
MIQLSLTDMNEHEMKLGCSLLCSLKTALLQLLHDRSTYLPTYPPPNQGYTKPKPKPPSQGYYRSRFGIYP